MSKQILNISENLDIHFSSNLSKDELVKFYEELFIKSNQLANKEVQIIEEDIIPIGNKVWFFIPKQKYPRRENLFKKMNVLRNHHDSIYLFDSFKYIEGVQKNQQDLHYRVVEITKNELLRLKLDKLIDHMLIHCFFADSQQKQEAKKFKEFSKMNAKVHYPNDQFQRAEPYQNNQDQQLQNIPMEPANSKQQLKEIQDLNEIQIPENKNQDKEDNNNFLREDHEMMKFLLNQALNENEQLNQVVIDSSDYYEQQQKEFKEEKIEMEAKIQSLNQRFIKCNPYLYKSPSKIKKNKKGKRKNLKKISQVHIEEENNSILPLPPFQKELNKSQVILPFSNQQDPLITEIKFNEVQSEKKNNESSAPIIITNSQLSNNYGDHDMIQESEDNINKNDKQTQQSPLIPKENLSNNQNNNNQYESSAPILIINSQQSNNSHDHDQIQEIEGNNQQIQQNPLIQKDVETNNHNNNNNNQYESQAPIIINTQSSNNSRDHEIMKEEEEVSKEIKQFPIISNEVEINNNNNPHESQAHIIINSQQSNNIEDNTMLQEKEDNEPKFHEEINLQSILQNIQQLEELILMKNQSDGYSEEEFQKVYQSLLIIKNQCPSIESSQSQKDVFQDLKIEEREEEEEEQYGKK